MEVRLAAELARLAECWRVYWPGTDVAAMATDVEERAERALAAWDLAPGELLSGGVVGLVRSARRGGEEVVLKVLPRGHEEEGEMRSESAVLATWAGSGVAVELLDRRDDGLTLLLERLTPGVPLDGSGIDDAERLRTLGEVVSRLQAVPTAAEPAIVGLGRYCEPWRRDLAGHPAEIAELDALLASTTEETVLHADLHGGNVLSHHGHWVAIDPHGAYGDPAAEIWSLIDPLSPVLDLEPAAIPAAVAEFAAAAGLDPSRAARWARLRAIAEARLIQREAEPDEHQGARAVQLLGFAAALP